MLLRMMIEFKIIYQKLKRDWKVAVQKIKLFLFLELPPLTKKEKRKEKHKITNCKPMWLYSLHVLYDVYPTEPSIDNQN